MARSVRQSKVIEIVNTREIEKQEELVYLLREAGFEVTQATVSRDVKELGLLKVRGEKKRYKYAFIDKEDKKLNSKANEVYRNVVLSTMCVFNQVVVKTIRGTTDAVAGVIERLSLIAVLGIVKGDDTLLIITKSEEDARYVKSHLDELLNK